MTSPRESGIINAKIANGEVKPDSRFPAKLKKPPAFIVKSEAEVPVHDKEDKKNEKKEPSEKPKNESKIPKEPTPKGPKESEFPCEGFINKYHFMRVSPTVLKALGWKINGNRLAVELDVKDGVLIVRKPSK